MARPPSAARARLRARQSAVEQDVRREVARELHDRVAQTLVAMLIDLENFKAETVDQDNVLRQLNAVQDSTRHALRSLRQLLFELRDEEAERDGFASSVGSLVARFEDRTGITTTLSVDATWPPSLSQPASANLYRIIEEALANVHWHSGARSVEVALRGGGNGHLSVDIIDDGHGFEPDVRPPGMGTVGMRERALIMGGMLAIDSAPGGGTAVRAWFPREAVAAGSDRRPVDEAGSAIRTADLKPQEMTV